MILKKIIIITILLLAIFIGISTTHAEDIETTTDEYTPDEPIQKDNTPTKEIKKTTEKSFNQYKVKCKKFKLGYNKKTTKKMVKKFIKKHNQGKRNIELSSQDFLNKKSNKFFKTHDNAIKSYSLKKFKYKNPYYKYASKKERKMYKIPKKLTGYIVKIYYYQYIMSY